MWLHAGAFALYLIGDVVYYGTWAMRMIGTRHKYALIGTTFFLYANFLS
jgi:hypothetical protein